MVKEDAYILAEPNNVKSAIKNSVIVKYFVNQIIAKYVKMDIVNRHAMNYYAKFVKMENV
jgi:hypothetical protein